MNIINKTHWRTDHLKAIIQKVAQEELTPEQRRYLRVTVVYARRHGCSTGYAYYNSSIMKVRVQYETFNKTDFAMVTAHEMAHTRGLRHRSMNGNPNYDRMEATKGIYAWAESMPMEKKTVKAAVKPGDDAKLAKVVSMVDKWERKVRRDQNVLKKWKKREKYFQKKIAAKGLS